MKHRNPSTPDIQFANNMDKAALQQMIQDHHDQEKKACSLKQDNQSNDPSLMMSVNQTDDRRMSIIGNIPE